MEKIWTIIDIVRWGTEYFAKHSIESARLNIELILCDALNIRRLDIYTQYEKPLAEAELNALREMITRRAKREPLQYILSKHTFIDIDLKLQSSVLIPRPETELLAEKAVAFVSKLADGATVLDIGTGSGCIALYVAKHCPNAKVTAIDVSLEAIEIAQANAEMNNLHNVNFFCSDILSVTPKKKYDLIISNPPYISEEDFAGLEAELMFEPKIALSDNGDGYAFYRRFTEFFASIMKEESEFLLEIGFGQDKYLGELFDSKGFDVQLFNDYANIPRILQGQIKKH